MRWNENYFNELGTSPRVVAIIENATAEVANVAKSTAAVDTGEYRDGIVTRTRRTAHRVVGEVVATAPHSAAVESRTGNLQRALRTVTGSG